MSSTGWQIVCYTVFPFGAVLAAMANHSSSWAIYMLVAGLFRPETPATLSVFAQLDVSDAVFRQLVQWREFGSLLGVLAASCSLTFMFEYGQDALAIFSICQVTFVDRLSRGEIPTKSTNRVYSDLLLCLSHPGPAQMSDAPGTRGGRAKVGACQSVGLAASRRSASGPGH